MVDKKHATITAALAAFQSDLPKVGKGSTNPAFKSKYADLADIVAVVLPKLAEHGLAWVTTPTFTVNGFVLAYELRHEGGESITGEWPLPDPSAASSQQMGSAVTYGKRYALSAVTGIAPDDDDDGNKASEARSAPRRRPSAQETVDAAVKAVNECTDPVKLDDLEALAQQRGVNGVQAVKDALESKRAELGPSGVDHWAPVAEIPT